MEPIRLSVRRITEFVLRCGDIESRFVDPNAMWIGSRAHRKLQAAMGPDYQKEVRLECQAELDGIPIRLCGRADGVIIKDDHLLVDEIKTTTAPLNKLLEQKEVHLGQAVCYAYMLLQKLDPPPSAVTLQLTYYQLNTEEKEIHRFEYTPGGIADYFSGIMARYAVWLRFERDWRLLRDASIRETGFPYPAYRKGQREMAVAVYRTIERKKMLYAQAPTGVGKTLSTLFPSIKALGEGLAEKIFYLTAKTVTRTVAMECASLMSAKGLRLKSVTLRAKEKICFCEEMHCAPEHCEYAKGHYDRINDALLELLNREDIITPALIEESARARRVCPFEMALDLTLWADLIICDYNHVFDPMASLKRFFGDDEAQGEYIFLVDEAHNLPDRVRDMYSADIRRTEFSRAQRGLRGRSSAAKRLRKALANIVLCFAVLHEGMEGDCRVDEAPLPGLIASANEFMIAAPDWLAREQANPMQKSILELYFNVMAFAAVAENYDDRYATIVERENSDTVYTLFCVDPSAIAAKRLGLGRACVLFSATLTPLPYYRDILGGTDEDYLISLPSPFAPERLLLLAHRGISTKYRHRERSAVSVAEAVALTIGAAKGNYIVYFPSYAYMKQVYEIFTRLLPDVSTLVQDSAMTEDDRARFLSRFAADNPDTLVGFCVLGGSFSEGIDLKGERLIGAVIVGVGLPEINLRSDLIRDYFDRERGERGGVGFDYAYVFPGMNKVLQAAGRVIRSEEDSGTVLLIDSRFGTPEYRRLYPAHWVSSMRYVGNQSELAELLDRRQL